MTLLRRLIFIFLGSDVQSGDKVLRSDRQSEQWRFGHESCSIQDLAERGYAWWLQRDEARHWRKIYQQYYRQRGHSLGYINERDLTGEVPNNTPVRWKNVVFSHKPEVVEDLMMRVRAQCRQPIDVPQDSSIIVNREDCDDGWSSEKKKEREERDGGRKRDEERMGESPIRHIRNLFKYVGVKMSTQIEFFKGQFGMKIRVMV